MSSFPIPITTIFAGLLATVFKARVVGTSLTWLVLAVGGLLALSVVA